MEIMTKQGSAPSVPKGYKQTKVGLIPVDWEIKKIGSLSEIATGSTPSTRDKSNYGEEYLFIGPGDLGRNKIITTSEKKLSHKGYSLSRKFPKGSILFTCIGSTIGKSGIASVDLTSNQQINAVFPNTTFDTNFLYYELQLIAKKIKSQAGEQAVPMVNKTEFSEFKIPLPPTLTEQKAIATALSDVDALINSLESLITKKKAIKQGAMQELLTGKTRVKGFEGSGRTKQTEVGLIPEDWKVKPIGDLAFISTGGSDTQDRVDDGVYPFFVRSQTIERINKYSFDGEAILTSGDGVGVGKIFHYVNCKFDYHQRVYNIHNFGNNVFGKYLFFQFSTHFYDRVMAMTAKSSVDSVRREMIADMTIPLPPTLTEQKAIAQILSDMDEEIEQLETKKDKYQAIKQGMMQELLTGKTRLI